MLKSPDRRTPRGMRDAAILELLYATGLRASELVSVRVSSVDLDSGLLHVTQGRGQDRWVPIPSDALMVLRGYVLHGRKAILAERRRECEKLFLPSQQEGKTLTPDRVSHIVSAAAGSAGIEKAVFPSSLRRSLMVHLFEHGVDIEVIQALHRSTSDCAAKNMFRNARGVWPATKRRPRRRPTRALPAPREC